MRNIYILVLLTVMLLATPMTEEKALELFEAIKQSEYSRVVSQWDNDEDPIDSKDNAIRYPQDRVDGHQK